MKTNIKLIALLVIFSITMGGCGSDHNKEDGHNHGANEESEHHEEGEEEGHSEEVHFSEQQFESLAMKVKPLTKRNISSYVEANGQLEVPPQNEATVTAVIGANVSSIEVIEGDKIHKGQVLAYLNHPNLIKIQTDYVSSWNELQYLEKEFERQQKLYDEKITSGKEFQKTKSDYQSKIALVKGFEAQLKNMGLNLDKLQQSEIYNSVPLRSPIDGYVRLVEVKTGQFVQPQTELFEIVNNEHIHADFMVFEKDMHKVKEGQKIKFISESAPDKELTAIIHSVGKAFEQDPKAIHLHAEIENKEGLLIPGMYVRGRIMTTDTENYALPEAGVVREGDKYFIFTAEQEKDNGKTEWTFTPVEVIVGANDDGWVEIKLLKLLKKGVKVAWNNAYYLMADMKKGEAEHEH
ncbi:MAG: efflux RND transporter periplasmic adaptor subunit [Flavobacteriales bacterium]|nr:efflux RND transporter periplasmic adaptor subunit [Flavobacteriales bacterium]